MSTQVGTGEVAIVPTIKGFRRAVESEVDSTAKSAKGVFESGFASAGTTAGSTTGKGFHQAFSGQTKSTTEQLVKSIERDVAKAAREVSQARLREQDAAGKVKIAEAQLAEVRKKYSDDSSQVVRAEERLQSAQRQLADRQGTTKASTDKLKSAQKSLADAAEQAERELRDAGDAADRASGDMRQLASSADRAGDELDETGRAGGGRFSSGISTGIKGAAGLILGAVAALGIGSMITNAVDEGVRAVKDYVTESISLASDLEQSVGAIDSVFKESSDTILAWSEGAAQSVGLSQNKYQELATIVGAQLKNMGFSLDEVTGQTGDLVGLGADLAAQFGGTTSEAVSALSSLLRGERDPIERYGVTINEAAVKAKALSLGLVTVTADADKVAAAQMRAEVAQTKYNEAVAQYGEESTQALSANASLISAQSSLETAMNGTTEELTAQQKAQATLALLYEQTTDAQGTFARENDTLAGQQARLTAEWENAQAKLGTALLPALTELAKVANEELIPVLNDMIEEIGPELGAALSESVPAIADMLVELAPLIPELTELAIEVLPPLVSILETLAPLLVGFADGAGQAAAGWGGVIDLMKGDTTPEEFAQKMIDMDNGLAKVGESLGQANWFWAQVFDTIGQATEDMGAAVGDGINTAIDWVTGLPQRAVDALGDIGSKLYNSGRELIGGFIDGIRGMIDDAGAAAADVLNTVRDFFPFSPAKRGPLSGSGWTRLRESGQKYIEQWSSGVREGAVGFALPDMVTRASRASISVGPLMGASAGGAASRVLRVEAPVSVEMVERDPTRVGRQIIRGVVEAVGAL